jgi:hypothetical protein
MSPPIVCLQTYRKIGWFSSKTKTCYSDAILLQLKFVFQIIWHQKRTPHCRDFSLQQRGRLVPSTCTSLPSFDSFNTFLAIKALVLGHSLSECPSSLHMKHLIDKTLNLPWHHAALSASNWPNARVRRPIFSARSLMLDFIGSPESWALVSGGLSIPLSFFCFMSTLG